VKSKPGLMETANRGTLFLDEIAELPVSLQVKLLRSLQERQVRRVGGTALIRCDVRIVSASNRDLRDLVAKGQFREELFYRVNVITIQLPPLRERAGDVPLLAQAFLKRYRQRDIQGFDEGAMAALERYPWPGNVRELQNIVERACALAEGDRITRVDLPAYLLERASPAAASRDSAALPARAGAGASGPPPTLERPSSAGSRISRAPIFATSWLSTAGISPPRRRSPESTGKTFHRLLNRYGVR
jgi:two-component system response regulator PilR (NtrC family)